VEKGSSFNIMHALFSVKFVQGCGWSRQRELCSRAVALSGRV